ncbi:MAG TPA: dihydrofolate reductase family protein [Gaiellales bacterium]|nr:dihydrofolate reductase family protein [Gaiellales bacterium]
MGRLIYSVIGSLDGYVEDAAGSFEWAAPDEQVFAFVNQLERPIGTYPYGRRMYQTMVHWETAPRGRTPVERDFAEIWRSAEKVVFSSKAEVASSLRTRVEHRFDPDVVRRLKQSSVRDLTVGGACLAGAAIRAGVVDELQLIVLPVVVCAGKPYLQAGVPWTLELVDHLRFDSGTVFLRYRSPSASPP